MSPTRKQIEMAAYQRWQRRGCGHGLDREDWIAAEKDLVFALSYRYIARHKLVGEPLMLGKAECESEEAGRRRRCRFCEQAEPAASFAITKPALPEFVGNTALLAWDECDDCRELFEEHLGPMFEAFARPLLGATARLPRAGIPIPALKALARMAVSVMPESELHHFSDTIEWISNPDHSRDDALLGDLGCHVYLTPVAVTSPFVALARRASAGAPWPYALFFLGTGRVVFQIHVPFCSRDEDVADGVVRGPVLSMSLGLGADHRASRCAFLPVERVGCALAGASAG
jgi:hypothetical protein